MELLRLRAWICIAGGIVFAVQFAVLDGFFRGLRGWAEPAVALAVVESVVLWAALVALARVRAARVAVALVAAVIAVVQAFVFRYYHVPLDIQVAASALHSWRDVSLVLVRALPYVIVAVVVVFAIELALLELAHRELRPSRRVVLILSSLAVVGIFVIRPRHATPDVQAAHALGALGGRRAEAPRRGPTPELPPLHVDRAELPSVLFILTESVRAEDYVTEGDDATARETDAAVRKVADAYVPLREMRSITSYTALSVSALLTGRSQEGPRDDILRSPSLFDYARAARTVRGEHAEVAYFSSQSEELFETKDVPAAATRFVTVETLLGRAVEDESTLDGLPLDHRIVDRFVAELPSIAGPTVAVLHLYGTHAPYFFEEERARFQPWDRVVAWSRMPRLRNAYKNAIASQDREVARAVTAFVEHAHGRPWVVTFTSDHGEAFGEHGAIHHGQNLYDEQVHVPGWIAAGSGAVDADQARTLADHAGRFVTHLDLLPTVLDALGLWENFALKKHRDAMPGKSLLRAWVARAPLPVTNCTGMFPCPLDTWGLFGGDHKLVAQRWDGGWACLDLRAGEHPAIADDPACAHLREASRQTFPRLPNGAPNR